MLKVYAAKGDCLAPVEPTGAGLDRAVWIDLINPSREEEKGIESQLGIELPSREEMQFIELSSRLYQESGALFMTGELLARVDQLLHSAEAVTFVLTNQRLVTIRYDNVHAFETVVQKGCRPGSGLISGDRLLVGLLQAENDYLARVLERVGRDLDEMSRQVFQRNGSREANRQFSEVLIKLGRREDLLSHVRDSVNTLSRMISFLRAGEKSGGLGKELSQALKSEDRDVRALSEYLDRLATKIGFLLEATLGLVNVEQNQIIKIFSVAAVVFMPPTLIASIYGMNFKHMPELEWYWGYPLALALMVLAAGLPIWLFRRRGWL
jgi:magnesium transporter